MQEPGAPGTPVLQNVPHKPLPPTTAQDPLILDAPLQEAACPHLSQSGQVFVRQTQREQSLVSRDLCTAVPPQPLLPVLFLRLLSTVRGSQRHARSCSTAPSLPPCTQVAALTASFLLCLNQSQEAFAFGEAAGPVRKGRLGCEVLLRVAGAVRAPILAWIKLLG